MNKLIIFLALAILCSKPATAQESKGYSIVQVTAWGAKNFEIIGPKSDAFADSLFSNLPKTKRKGYLWKFKGVQVPGIEGKLTFQVHQGLSGSTNPGTSYFNTFKNEKYKQMRLGQQIPSEQHAIIVYVKRGRKHVIKTAEEVALIRNYLLSIFEG